MVNIGQVTPGTVGGRQAESGIEGMANSAVAPGFTSAAGKQVETGIVGIGQFTPGIVCMQDKVGNPFASSPFGGGQFTPGIVAGGGQLINGIVFGIHEPGGIVGNDFGFPAAPPPPAGFGAGLGAGFAAVGLGAGFGAGLAAGFAAVGLAAGFLAGPGFFVVAIFFFAPWKIGLKTNSARGTGSTTSIELLVLFTESLRLPSISFFAQPRYRLVKKFIAGPGKKRRSLL